MYTPLTTPTVAGLPSVAYTYASGPPTGRRDWLYAILLVSGLTGLGVLFSYATRFTLYSYTFSYRVACLYVPVAAAAILFLGYGRFPLAATLFYGFLPIAQAAHAQDFVAGELKTALTFEMLLALPVLVMGFVGPPGTLPGASRPLPGSLKACFGAILLAASVSTVLAHALGHALVALASRFALPMLVTVAVYRRLRTLAEYRTVWLGFVTGMILIGIFQYRRGVLGELHWAEQVSQRFLGASQSYAIPMLYAVGGLLWIALVRARRGAVLQATVTLLTVVVFGVLMWLGAARGPLVFFGLLLVWWLLHLLRQVHRPGVLLSGTAIVLAGFYLVRYSLTRTTLDVYLVLERMSELRFEGLAGHDRAAVWRIALNYWKENPLWGMGLNNWSPEQTGYESAHSLVFGLLTDMGVFGLLVFGLFFGVVLRMTRRSLLWSLPPDERTFFTGCRAGWIIMLLCLVTNLPFTSGQPRNQIFAYMVYFFPLLVMLVYSRSPAWSTAQATAWPTTMAPASPWGLPAPAPQAGYVPRP